MKREDYLTQRNALMEAAGRLLDDGKTEEANAKMEEVKALDGRYDAEAKAEANLRALESTPRMVDLASKSVEVTGKAVERMDTGDAQEAEKAVYVNAWSKYMMNKAMTDEEKKTFRMVNEAYTHTTENTGVVIPETVAAGIWEEIGDLYPLWADVSKTFVNGTLTILKGDTSSEAKWYDEATATEDGKETFGTLTLGGCELSRAITVSWKLREMSVEDFIPYIQRKLAEKAGAALGYGASHGKGKPGEEDEWKPEPQGIVTALEAEASTPQVVTYTAGSLAYKDITAARAKIKSGYGAGLAIYANNATIWGELANVLDETGRPMFVSDVTAGGVGRVLGITVKEDASMNDGEILISNPGRGYTANVNKTLTLDTEDHKKQRTTDYICYAIVDGGVLTTKAHALLKKA